MDCRKCHVGRALEKAMSYLEWISIQGLEDGPLRNSPELRRRLNDLQHKLPATTDEDRLCAAIEGLSLDGSRNLTT